MATKVADAPLTLYALRRADDALVLGHRLSEWCGHAPMMEEDMALANIGLDLLGQARSMYQYVAELRADGSDEDTLAYLRDAPAYRNLLLAELPNGDFAHTIGRQFLYSAFADPYWRAMVRSSDTTLAAVAAKAEKETAYHLRHTAEWMIRLGDGTAESRRRTEAALIDLWPYLGEMFEADAAERELIAAGAAVDPAAIRTDWEQTVAAVLDEATLERPAEKFVHTGGRSGRHTEHLGWLLAEMQVLQRAHPGATW